MSESVIGIGSKVLSRAATISSGEIGVVIEIQKRCFVVRWPSGAVENKAKDQIWAPAQYNADHMMSSGSSLVPPDNILQDGLTSRSKRNRMQKTKDTTSCSSDSSLTLTISDNNKEQHSFEHISERHLALDPSDINPDQDGKKVSVSTSFEAPNALNEVGFYFGQSK